MNEFVPNDILIFVGGLFCGSCFTYFVFKSTQKPKERKENGDEKEIQTGVPGTCEPIKLILVVRNDLKMGKGKVAAQCSHAAVLAYELSKKRSPQLLAKWKSSGQPKIVVKVDSEEEMMELAKEAQKSRLLVSVVQDAGRTQIAAGSRTVLAVGPGPESEINKVTGYLKLY